MPELEILIKTRLEMAGAKAAADTLERQIGAAKAMDKPFADLEAQLARMRGTIAASGQGGSFLEKLNEQMRESIPGFARLETSLSGMAAGPLGYVAAGFVALGAAFKVAAAGVREYAEAEQGVVARDQALAQRGLLTDAYRESLSGLADEMRKLTGIDDDRWTAAITRLTQFGADSGNMSASVDAVKNLAGIMRGDLQGASEAVSRALQGNFMMFGRLGIHISETGTKAEKLAELYKKLADIGGGQLEARTHTLAGQYDKLKISVGEVTKGIGGLIAQTGIIQTALEFAGNAAEYWAEKLAPVIPMLAGLRNSTSTTTGAIEDQAEATKKATDEMDAWKTKMSEAAEEAKKLDEIKGKELSHADKMAEIESKRKLAMVDVREKEGTINPVQAIAARAVINTDLEKGKFDRKQAEEARKQAATVARSKEVVGTSRSEGEAVTAQESRAKEVEDYEKAKAKVDAAKAEVAQAEERLKAAKESGPKYHGISIIDKARNLYEMKQALELKPQIPSIEAEIGRGKKLVTQKEAALAGMTLPEGAESAAAEAAKATRLRAANEARAPFVEKEVGTLGFEVTKRALDIKNNAAEFGAQTVADRTVTAGQIRGQEVTDQKNAPVERVDYKNAAAILKREHDALLALLVTVVDGAAAKAAAIEATDAKLRATEADVNNLSGVVNRQRTP